MPRTTRNHQEVPPNTSKKSSLQKPNIATKPVVRFATTYRPPLPRSKHHPRNTSYPPPLVRVSNGKNKPQSLENPPPRRSGRKKPRATCSCRDSTPSHPLPSFKSGKSAASKQPSSRREGREGRMIPAARVEKARKSRMFGQR